MKIQQRIKSIFIAGLIPAFLSQCALSANLDGASETSSASESSDETQVEAAYTSAIESLVQSTNSSNESVSADSSASLTTSYLSSRFGSGRFRCADSESAEQSFSCNNADGTLEHSVVFTDCALERGGLAVTLNGSLEHAIENGGDGFCEASASFDFSKMVMGREDGDAVRNRETGPEGLVYSFTNARDFEVTLTATHTHTATYTEPVDENDDGTAESVTATIEREDHFVHEIAGQTAHDVTVFTANAEYSIVATDDEESDTDDTSDDANEEESEDETSEDGDLSESTSDDETSTVTVTLPVHTLLFDEDTGELTGRTIESGNLVVDHNLASIRIIMGVGEDGLTFDNGDTCGPVSGTLTTIGYELNDDGTLGDIIGTGEVTFEDGEVQSAEFAGEELELKRLPCH